MLRKAAFLDRDGTVVIDAGYARKPEELVLLPGVRDAVTRLKASGFLIIIITNQSGIGRGYLTEESYQLQIAKLAELLGPAAAPDGHYYCPHHPTEARAPYNIDCNCRKPKPGLFLRAITDFNIDVQHSFAIGDTDRDLIAARAAGIHITEKMDPSANDGFHSAVEAALKRIPQT
ncbi:MAG: D-glycero-alpha-D-manno-heptose-1,7-bisphosphate 7-phosphatase [Planctomycetota bacterium]